MRKVFKLCYHILKLLHFENLMISKCPYLVVKTKCVCIDPDVFQLDKAGKTFKHSIHGGGVALIPSPVKESVSKMAAR